MDRTLYWDENQSRTFDYVQDAKDTLKALAQMMGDALGQTATVIAGLPATASAPASLSINLGAGAIYQLADIDATANGAIAQDTTQVLQQGIIGAQTITLSTAGIASGQSQWQLIECQFSQSDVIRAGDPNGGLLFFYNAGNVSQPFQGPGGAGTTTPTVRQGLVTVQVISGAAATTGSEVPPQPTPGWTPLYIVDLSFGQSQITQAQIHAAAPSAGTGVPNTYPYAPFLTGLTNSHHGGVPGQAPKIKLGSEVQGTLPIANLPALNYGNLPFTPVQQGGGANQGSNRVYIGWDSAHGALRAQVDVTDMGNFAMLPLPHNELTKYDNVQVFGSSGNFTVPSDVTIVEVEVWGGGGGSPAGYSPSGYASAGGGGGGYARKICAVSPGQVIFVTVGAGGAAGNTGALPGNGGTSSFGAFCSATGGVINGGTALSNPVPGGPPGQGFGGDVNMVGGWGLQPVATINGAGNIGGPGGDSPRGGGTAAGNVGASVNGAFPGGGAGGVGAGTAFGQTGANGLVIVRW